MPNAPPSDRCRRIVPIKDESDDQVDDEKHFLHDNSNSFGRALAPKWWSCKLLCKLEFSLPGYNGRCSIWLRP